jgi:hypothetical protein
MKRTGRLASARGWLERYSGKNILRSYCKHFGVDWRCAATELKALGVKIDPADVDQRKRAEAVLVQERMERKHTQQANAELPWHLYSDPFAAFLADDFAALHDLEERQASIEDPSRF